MALDLRFDAALHETSINASVDRLLSGNTTSSMWQRNTVNGIVGFQPQLLGIDSLPGYIVTPDKSRLEIGFDEFSGCSLAVVALPYTPSEISPDGEAMILGGDYESRMVNYKFPSHSLALVGPGVIGGALGIGGKAAYDTIREDFDATAIGRRKFLKIGGHFMLGAALGNALNVLLMQQSSQDSPVTPLGEIYVRNVPHFQFFNGTAPGQEVANTGRTALVTEKVINAANSLGLDRASLLFGNAHLRGDEVVTNQDKRHQAIVDLADWTLANLRFDREGLLKSDATIEEKLLFVRQTLAATSIAKVRNVEFDTPGVTNYQSVINAVTPVDRYDDPTVTELLAGWQPNN